MAGEWDTGPMNLPDALLSTLSEHFPGDAMATGMAERLAYAYDNSRRNALPDAVVFPPRTSRQKPWCGRVANIAYR